MLQDYTLFDHWADYYRWADKLTTKYGIASPVDWEDQSTEEEN